MHRKTTFRKQGFPLHRLLLVAALAGAALSGGLAYSRIAERAHPGGARMSASQASHRMMTLCNQYEGPCEIVSEPYFRDETHLPYPPYNLHRKLWQGTLHTNGHIMHMILNDTSGELGSVYYGGAAVNTSVQRQEDVAVTTPVEAARLTMHYLSALEIVPAKAEVALCGTPVCSNGREQWWVIWKVRSGPGAPSDIVQATLSRKTGKIMRAVDHRQMGQTL